MWHSVAAGVLLTSTLQREYVLLMLTLAAPQKQTYGSIGGRELQSARGDAHAGQSCAPIVQGLRRLSCRASSCTLLVRV